MSSYLFKQALWFDEFQTRTGTEGIGLEDWSAGTSTFSVAAQYIFDCFLRKAEEMAQGLERDLRPLVVNDIGCWEAVMLQHFKKSTTEFLIITCSKAEFSYWVEQEEGAERAESYGDWYPPRSSRLRDDRGGLCEFVQSDPHR